MREAVTEILLRVLTYINLIKTDLSFNDIKSVWKTIDSLSMYILNINMDYFSEKGAFEDTGAKTITTSLRWSMEMRKPRKEYFSLSTYDVLKAMIAIYGLENVQGTISEIMRNNMVINEAKMEKALREHGEEQKIKEDKKNLIEKL